MSRLQSSILTCVAICRTGGRTVQGMLSCALDGGINMGDNTGLTYLKEHHKLKRDDTLYQYCSVSCPFSFYSPSSSSLLHLRSFFCLLPLSTDSVHGEVWRPAYDGAPLPYHRVIGETPGETMHQGGEEQEQLQSRQGLPEAHTFACNTNTSTSILTMGKERVPFCSVIQDSFSSMH